MQYQKALEPRDEYNLTLESHVHPTDYQNPIPASRYNLVVIGAGTAGLVTAAGAAGLGAKVALVESGLMGGDCLNVGCVPSKAMVSAARAVAAVREASRFGVYVPNGVSIDFAGAMKRMRKLRSEISHHDSVKRFTDMGIDVFLGQGRFLDRSTVVVNDAKLKFRKAVIATGARAAAPPIPGLESINYLTNETLFSLTELPPRLGVIGGGPIGCEMSQTFARFGAKVSLIESGLRIMDREDPDAAHLITESLQADGVDISCNTKNLSVANDLNNTIRLSFVVDGQARVLVVDQLLVAVGRAPNVEGLHLDKAGVVYHPKGVVVDDFFRTTNRRIFAAGDICSPYKFTHAADFMARAVIRNALFMGQAKSSQLVIPWCTYTSPEVAHVGLTEAGAETAGIAINTFTQEMSGVDRAILEGKTKGFVRIHVKKGTDQIVGATIVSAHAGDMIGTLSMAMTHKIGLGSIANVIHPYPTVGEAVRKVGDIYNRTRLTPQVQNIFTKWLQWTR